MKRNVYLPQQKNVSFREGNPLCVGCKMPDYAAKAIYKVHFKTSKIYADKELKNHYISSKKTSINNGKKHIQKAAL